MGCVSSKQRQKVCQQCQATYSPAASRIRSPIHISRRRKSDSINHVSKKLDHSRKRDEQKKTAYEVIMDFPMAIAVVEAKNWSEMIEKKIPKILSKEEDYNNPPREEPPETINTWELMEGLEDNSPPSPPPPRSEDHLRSFSFQVDHNPLGEETCRQSSGHEMSRNDSNSTSETSELDAELEMSSFRKALEELHPANPFHLNPISVCPEESRKTNIFGNDERVVLYFTSLRGVRKTYKDCCYVRITLRELGFMVDERDVSMHSGFKGELKELLRGEEEEEEERVKGLGLPRVFVGKKYIGGVEEIRHLHEEGGLEKALEGCERSSGSVSWRRACQGCGDIRFVPCETCRGSCKIFYEHDEDFYYQQQCDESEYGFQRCPDCNENGLIRCPICCDYK